MEAGRSIFGIPREELAGVLTGWEEPSFRADQLFGWLYRSGLADPRGMTDLPKALREKLLRKFSFELPVVKRSEQADDGIAKYCLGLKDGLAIECVAMPESSGGGISFCISSQVGCALGCSFCRTGAFGFKRNLDAAEIVSQVIVMLAKMPGHPDHLNVLFMGMGEPLLNFEAVHTALEIIGDPKGLAVPMRRVVISTAGIAEDLQRLQVAFQSDRLPGIAISLNAPDQELRERLMPIAGRIPLDQLMLSLKEMPVLRDRLTIEYVMLAGVNDRPGHAERLAGLLRGMKLLVNLIPFNEFEGSQFETPDEKSIDAFIKILIDSGLRCTVRRSRGRQIAAACGQLAVV